MERYEAITLTSIALFERIVFILIVEWFPLLLILLELSQDIAQTVGDKVVFLNFEYED